MKKIQIKFQTDIIDSELEKEFYIHGPLFHRWLPDGEKDQILLLCTKNKIQISVWFNRYGSVVDKFCVFNEKKKEIDEAVMEKQGKLDGGRLFVRCENIEIEDDVLDIIKNNNIGDDKYIEFAKKISKEIMPVINSFINVLRINYGQYWLTPLKLFDSRDGSIGHYWTMMFANWKTPRREKWNRFKPDNGEIRLNSILNDKFYANYINKNDWQNINKILKGKVKNEASEVLLNAYKLIELGNIKYAFLESTLALELALNSLYKEKFKKNKIISEQLGQFFNLSLSSKFVATSAFITEDINSELENALEAIKVRNKVAHGGYAPKKTDEKNLVSLLGIINKLLPQPGVRRTEFLSGNCLCPSDKWDEIYKKNI